MGAYIVRRLLLIIPTLFVIIALNFGLIQFAPGGPVDQIIAEQRGFGEGATDRFTGAGGDAGTNSNSGKGAGNTQGLDEEYRKQLEKQFGFDKPVHVRFFTMLRDYITFNFGESYFKKRPVIDLIVERIPISAMLGLSMLFLTYAISVPLGIRKAVKAGSRFDVWSGVILTVMYAVPSFLFAVVLLQTLAAGSPFEIFPVRGIETSGWDGFGFWGRITSLAWWQDAIMHITLPVAAMMIGAFTGITMLTRNYFLEEMTKQYCITARAKGLKESSILYGHVFRNAMIVIISGIPAAFVGAFFAGSLLIEVVFSIDGLGKLGYEAALNRDYPVMFSTLFIFTLMGLVLGIVSDLMYAWLDPRIDFESN